MAQKLLKSVTAYTDCAYIAHGGDIPLAERLGEKIKELLPRLNVRIDYLTPALGIHAGPGSLVLSFRGASRLQILQDIISHEKLNTALADV
jgi:fatty acid-binding protein DegV